MKDNIHNPIDSFNGQGKDTSNNLINLIRVGHDYFEIVGKPDRYGILRTELKYRRRSELTFDFGSELVKKIKKYKDFILVPDNLNYQRDINGCFNLYQQFNHEPVEGDWTWSKILLEHVFGEQYDIGLKYMQALYQNPDRILPILVLVSAERQTGKSTFLDWLTIIFGGNMIIIDSKHLSSSFNSIIAKANIIAIEETLIEKSSTIEAVKALSTQKTITVNQKFVQPYSSSFFGKIIMASNNEKRFIKVDSKEIRFFVRKLGKPKFMNHNILENLKTEIPAFMHFLNQQSCLSWNNSRQLFTADELKNSSLSEVQFESKSWLFHELYDLFVNEFNNVKINADILELTLTDIKDKWFKSENNVNRSYIKKVLIDEFGFTNSKKAKRYGDSNHLVGKPYLIPRIYFKAEVSEPRVMDMMQRHVNQFKR